MKPPFNPFLKKIITTMALSGALLCSFAANAVYAPHDSLKLKEAAPADTKTKPMAPEPLAVKPALPGVPAIPAVPPLPGSAKPGNDARGGLVVPPAPK